jgi:hypothetical protein
MPKNAPDRAAAKPAPQNPEPGPNQRSVDPARRRGRLDSRTFVGARGLARSVIAAARFGFIDTPAALIT